MKSTKKDLIVQANHKLSKREQDIVRLVLHYRKRIIFKGYEKESVIIRRLIKRGFLQLKKTGRYIRSGYFQESPDTEYQLHLTNRAFRAAQRYS